MLRVLSRAAVGTGRLRGRLRGVSSGVLRVLSILRVLPGRLLACRDSRGLRGPTRLSAGARILTSGVDSAVAGERDVEVHRLGAELAGFGRRCRRARHSRLFGSGRRGLCDAGRLSLFACGRSLFACGRSLFACGRLGLVGLHGLGDLGGRRGADDRLGADRLLALFGDRCVSEFSAAIGALVMGLKLLRTGALGLLIRRVLGGVLTHSSYATGVAAASTARRPPTPARVFPTTGERPHTPDDAHHSWRRLCIARSRSV